MRACVRACCLMLHRYLLGSDWGITSLGAESTGVCKPLDVCVGAQTLVSIAGSTLNCQVISEVPRYIFITVDCGSHFPNILLWIQMYLSDQIDCVGHIFYDSQEAYPFLVCVFVCLCMWHVHICVGAYLCACMWRPEINLWCHSTGAGHLCAKVSFFWFAFVLSQGPSLAQHLG